MILVVILINNVNNVTVLMMTKVLVMTSMHLIFTDGLILVIRVLFRKNQ